MKRISHNVLSKRMADLPSFRRTSVGCVVPSKLTENSINQEKMVSRSISASHSAAFSKAIVDDILTRAELTIDTQEQDKIYANVIELTDEMADGLKQIVNPYHHFANQRVTSQEEPSRCNFDAICGFDRLIEIKIQKKQGQKITLRNMPVLSLSKQTSANRKAAKSTLQPIAKAYSSHSISLSRKQIDQKQKDQDDHKDRNEHKLSEYKMYCIPLPTDESQQDFRISQMQAFYRQKVAREHLELKSQESENQIVVIKSTSSQSQKNRKSVKNQEPFYFDYEGGKASISSAKTALKSHMNVLKTLYKVQKQNKETKLVKKMIERIQFASKITRGSIPHGRSIANLDSVDSAHQLVKKKMLQTIKLGGGKLVSVKEI